MLDGSPMLFYILYSTTEFSQIYLYTESIAFGACECGTSEDDGDRKEYQIGMFGV